MAGSWTVVEGMIARRPEPELRNAGGTGSFGPPFDDADKAPATRHDRIDMDGLAIGLIYRDASGQRSERTVRCREWWFEAGLYYLSAWCKLRGAERTFRADRIEAVVDYTTGERIDDVASFFAPYIGERPSVRDTRPAGIPATHVTAADLVRTFRDGAKVLLYLAMSDAHLHPAERQLVLAYASRRVEDRFPKAAGGATPMIERWIDNHVPSRSTALGALRNVAAERENGGLLAYALVDLIIADGAVSDDEMAAAWGLVKALERRERSTSPDPA